MEEAAKKIGYDCKIAAYPVAEAATRGADADIILLGPQVRFQLDRVKEQVSCPAEAIDMTAYGMMNGAAVIDRVKKVLGD